MAKTYKIKLEIDASQADQATAKQQREQAKVEQAALRSAAAQERAAQRTADAQAREAKRAADQQAREARRVADQQARESQRAADRRTRDAQRVATAQAKADDAVTKELQRQADAQAKIVQKAADDRTRAAQRAQDRLSSMAGRALTDEELKAKGIGAINDRLNARRVASAVKAAERERWAAMSVREKFADVGETILGKVNPGMIAMGVGVAAVAAVSARVVKHWQDVAHDIQEAIRFTNQYRELLPENASLKGNLGDTTKESRDSLALRTKTLQTVEQARDFEAGFLNTGQVSIGTKITQATADQLKVAGGSFQAAEGGSATTHGELLGTLPSLMKTRRDFARREIPLTAKEVTDEQARLFDINQLGRTSFTSGTEQLLKNSSLTQTGAFNSIAEQAAVQSAFSLVSKDQAGEMTQWLQRATIGNLGRMTDSGIEGSEKVGAYLNKLGVGQETQGLPVAKAISADLAKQEGAARQEGRQFSAQKYLGLEGFGNQEDIKALTSFHALNQDGRLEQFLAKARGTANAQPVLDKIAASRADPMMEARSVQLSGDLEKFTQERASATADQYRRQIFEEVKATGLMAGKYEDVEKDPFQFEQTRLQRFLNAGLRRDAAKAGVEIGELPEYRPWASQAALDRPIQDAIDKIQGAKVDPFAESRTFIAGRARSNLDRSIAAEAAPRAGLAAGEQARRDAQFRGGRPDPGDLHPGPPRVWPVRPASGVRGRRRLDDQPGYGPAPQAHRPDPATGQAGPGDDRRLQGDG